MFFKSELIELTNVVADWFCTLTLVDKFSVAAVVVAHRVVALAGMWAYALFTLVGTIFHELTHLVFALFLGARPSFPSLIPEQTQTGWRLGSVKFSSGLLRNIPIALAPLLLAPLGLWWAAAHMHPASGLKYLLHAWISGTLIMASMPSMADWKIAAPSLLLCAALWAAFHFAPI